MKTIIINCPDSARIASVVVAGGDMHLWASQRLFSTEDGKTIEIDEPEEENLPEGAVQEGEE